MAVVSILNNSDLEMQLGKSTIPVLVDFWADWCSPCKMIAPVLEEIANEYRGKFFVGKINVDENKDIPGFLNIFSIPTLIIFKEGKEVGRTIGYKSKDELCELLNKYL